MPRFQDYAATERLDPGSTPQVRTGAEAIGQGMQSLGQGLDEAARGLAHYQKLQEQKSAFATANLSDTFKQQQNGAFQTDLQHASADGSNFAVTAMQRYDKDQETFISSLPANQRERAAQDLMPYRQAYLNNAASKEHELSNAYSTNTLKDNYTTTLNAVNADPTQRDTLTKGLFQRIDMAPSLEPAQKEEMKRSFTNGIAIQYVKSVANADPAKVRQLQGMPIADQKAPTSGGAVPGASGYGAINAAYKAPLTSTGEGGKTGPMQMYSYLKSQGASDNEALMLTGAAANESSFNPNAVHDGGSGTGLFGHNHGRLDMRGKDWQQQATLALQELRSRPESALVNKAQNADDLAVAQMHFERPRGYSSSNPRAGDNFTGRFNTIRYFSALKNGPNGLPPYAEAALSQGGQSQSSTNSGDATGSIPQQPQRGVTSDPALSSLTPDQWDALYNSARTQQSQNQALARGSLEPIVQDATSALLTNGRYDGRMPTQQDFTAAYGAQEGSQRYSQFRQVQDIGQHIDAFKSETPEQIQADVAAARPISSGEGFAMAQSRYEAMQKAAATTIKMRQDDPAGYIKSINPQVAALWQGANTPEGYRTALSAMSAAQSHIGIAGPNQKLLPDDFAKQTIDAYKNDALTVQQRMAPVLGAILRTSDPDQQKAIFGQLVKAGLPTTMTGAIEAYTRGDQGAGDRLMSAIMLAPSKIPTDGAVKAADINTAVAAIMAPNQIGSMAYGLQNGNPDNIGRAQDGMEILRRAAQMRVAQGETDATKAVNDAAKDLFGNQRAYTNTFGGMNFSAIIPNDADLGPLSRGVIAMRPQIEAAAANAATEFVRQKNLSKGNPTTEAVMSADIKAQTSNIMNSGQIINYGRDGFAFLDAYTNKFVPGPDGKPLVFKLADFQAADKAAQISGSQQPSQGAPWFLGGAGQTGMNFLPPQAQAPTKAPSIPPTKPQAGSVPTSGNDAFGQATQMFGTNPENIGGPM
ncbi:phage tail tip lysozyme [Labrys neptuniae]